MSDIRLVEAGDPLAVLANLGPPAALSGTATAFVATYGNGPDVIEVSFQGTGFAYNENGEPVSGPVTQIQVRSSAGLLFTVDFVNFFDVPDLGPLFGAFRVGPLAALDGVLNGLDDVFGTAQSDTLFTFGAVFDDPTKGDVVLAGGGDDLITVRGHDGAVLIGGDGNDTFVIQAGSRAVKVSGTNVYGDWVGTENNVVRIEGDVDFASVQAVSNVVFTGAQRVTAQADRFFTLALSGSAAGANDLMLTSSERKVDLDLSGLVLTGWNRPDQTVTVRLNTDPSKSFDDRFVGSAAGEIVSAGNGRDLLSGGGGNDRIDGGGGSDILEGGDGDDTLIGGDGPNLLFGGNGNDVYEVTGGDTVIDDGTGIDTVLANASFTLGDGSGIEILRARDPGSKTALALTGNALDNSVIGNAGDNVLRGLGGADLLQGGLGNDTYHADASDLIVEAAGGGTDIVETLDSFALAEGVEIEVLSAAGASLASVSLTGNAFGNTLIGHGGANVLDGGGGADLLIGGSGDDRYVVDGADRIVEAAGGGLDTIVAGASFGLAALPAVEALIAAPGAGAVVFTGNDGANALTGGAGADRLNGGAGSDRLTGRLGRDVFVFDTKAAKRGVDAITDFRKEDTIRLDDKTFKGLKNGILAKGAFALGSVAKEADDRILYDRKKGLLYHDADGTGAGKAVAFAHILNKATLTCLDFEVV